MCGWNSSQACEHLPIFPTLGSFEVLRHSAPQRPVVLDPATQPALNHGFVIISLKHPSNVSSIPPRSIH